MQIAMTAPMIHLSNQVSAISELDDIDALLKLYGTRVQRYVVFAIGDQDIADTITQECFLKAYTGRDNFRGDCSISTWLFSIANNLIRDQIRIKKFQFWRKASANAIDVQEMASFLPSNEASPETRLLAQERMGQVTEALEKLSINQRKVFILRVSEGLDLHEISSSTGMPINTVKTHLYRAVTAIRSNLGVNA
jgi:RNA polymerase sigma-70 factor (ECF subfamily)